MNENELFEHSDQSTSAIVSRESTFSESKSATSVRGQKIQNIFNLFRQNSLAYACGVPYTS